MADYLHVTQTKCAWEFLNHKFHILKICPHKCFFQDGHWVCMCNTEFTFHIIIIIVIILVVVNYYYYCCCRPKNPFKCTLWSNWENQLFFNWFYENLTPGDLVNNLSFNIMATTQNSPKRMLASVRASVCLCVYEMQYMLCVCW